MKPALLLASLMIWPLACAMAQETNTDKQLPEELAVTTSIVMQDADELETSVAFDQYKFSFPSSERKSTVAAEFQYGLTDRWELDAEIPYEFRDFNPGRSFNGIGDVEVGARYGVIPLNKGPVALDVGLAVGIPTGDRLHDLGEGRLTLEPSFTASTWLGPVNAQLNGRWQRAVTNAGDEPRDEFEYNIAILYPVSCCFLALEGNGISTSEATEYYVTPELIWKPMKRLEFLVAAPIGLTHTSADYGIVASVTLEWDNITHRSADKE
jgi:hypothetical protein